MSSDQATITESIDKTVCADCGDQIVPNKTPATNRDYCPSCGLVFEKREQKYREMDE